MYVYCVYPAISKSPKQQHNYLKIADAGIVLIIFSEVVALHVLGTRKKNISWSVILCNKYLSSQSNLTAQIEPVLEKI